MENLKNLDKNTKMIIAVLIGLILFLFIVFYGNAQKDAISRADNEAMAEPIAEMIDEELSDFLLESDRETYKETFMFSETSYSDSNKTFLVDNYKIFKFPVNKNVVYRMFVNWSNEIEKEMGQGYRLKYNEFDVIESELKELIVVDGEIIQNDF